LNNAGNQTVGSMAQLSGYDIFQNIFFFVQQKKKTHRPTGLEQHEDE